MFIDIRDDLINLNGYGLLESLLKDKTTKSNIIWATDAYIEYGTSFGRDKEIKVEQLLKDNLRFIKARSSKDEQQQSKRTKAHAEVMTPLWVCKQMNDYADEQWFGEKGVFDTKDTIVFPEGKTWKNYVESNRLEITCGEAPYLVSRYDATTGEHVKIEDRIGILDRKLRVVNENVDNEEDWLEWCIKAFKATYGYEFQGDNLIIARTNLLMTFKEYLKDRWDREPSIKEYRKLINIICWNIWQMNGLTDTIPYFNPQKEVEQLTFDFFNDEEEMNVSEDNPYCRIYDWKANKSIEYRSLKKGNM